MCARRFLGFVFILTLLVVAGAFAIYQWGGNVLLRQSTPKGHFEAAQAGRGPDYGDASSWIARPDIADSPSRWLPESVPTAASGDAAIFYIHPTTYLSNDRWNAPLNAGGDTAYRTSLFVQSQASAFNGAGEIWAPRYRQAAYGAFLLKSDDAQKALDLAFSDIQHAFREFLSNVHYDRPIILAAHSQGALHLERLLAGVGYGLKGRIVAAYVVGWPISTKADLPALGMPPCRTPDQSGCILSWMTFGEPSNPDFILDQWEKTRGPTGDKRRRADMLCVNPITGTQDGTATPQEDAGTLIPTANMSNASVQSGIIGASCRNGLLVIDGDVPRLGSFVLPGNNYHVYDYALFWGAIRRDAERRLAAWHKR